MIFYNFKDVAYNPERRMLLRLAEAGIKSVLPKNFINKYVKLCDGKLIVKNKKFEIRNKRIFVIGAGKMASEMAAELEKCIGHKNIFYGIVVSNHIGKMPKKIIVHKATHPIPSASSVAGAKKIIGMKKIFNIGKNDLIISLISGGGSSLLCYPKEGISLNEKKEVIKELIKCGANVHDITVIKKKMSRVKGGKLAQYFYPTPIISLIVSDVVGDNLEVIASGPFKEDKSTSSNALKIIKKYNLSEKIPESVLSAIKSEKAGIVKLRNVESFLLAKNSDALKAIKGMAVKSGLRVIVRGHVQGEASLAAKKISIEMKKPAKSTLFVYGGETTVTLSDRFGKGGRNQEFIAATLKYFDYKKFNDFDFAIASIASDGVDFINDSCGGIIDKGSFKKIMELGVDLDRYLKEHDSYNLLTRINSNLSTNGLTGTNVGDIMLFLFLRR